MKKPRFARARVYDLVCEAVENGVAYGWTRAHKHTDKPTAEAVKDNIEREVLNALCETFDFNETPPKD